VPNGCKAPRPRTRCCGCVGHLGSWDFRQQKGKGKTSAAPGRESCPPVLLLFICCSVLLGSKFGASNCYLLKIASN
jgi:hypothetical protein